MHGSPRGQLERDLKSLSHFLIKLRRVYSLARSLMSRGRRDCCTGVCDTTPPKRNAASTCAPFLIRTREASADKRSVLLEAALRPADPHTVNPPWTDSPRSVSAAERVLGLAPVEAFVSSLEELDSLYIGVSVRQDETPNWR
jgi:hypothetical protein